MITDVARWGIDVEFQNRIRDILMSVSGRLDTLLKHSEKIAQAVAQDVIVQVEDLRKLYDKCHNNSHLFDKDGEKERVDDRFNLIADATSLLDTLRKI